MKEISDVTACVVDNGDFLPVAFRLADQCKRVIVSPPAEITPASVRTGTIGDGFTTIERQRDFWPLVSEIDLFVFPDCQHAGLQTYLESIGKAVWGSRSGNQLELNRSKFMKLVEEFGLDVPVFETVKGVESLSDHLRDKEEKYIKVSRFRADMETFHWRDWKQDKGWLDWLKVRLGPIGDLLPFLVFDSIDTDLEIGADTYNIDGLWPGTMLHGIEGKDKSYFATVTPRDQMPKQCLEVMEAFSDWLGSQKYRQAWSMEVRVKDELAFFIDATTRFGLPSSASQQLLWRNFPEIIWHGANGILVQPEPAAKFSIETMVTAKTDPDTWEVVVLPEELNRNCRLSHCVFVDGAYCFPPDELKGGDLGWLCAIGNTPGETLNRIKELADQLPDGVNADVEALASVIQEIEKMQTEAGIQFTRQQMPEPADVL